VHRQVTVVRRRTSKLVLELGESLAQVSDVLGEPLLRCQRRELGLDRQPRFENLGRQHRQPPRGRARSRGDHHGAAPLVGLDHPGQLQGSQRLSDRRSADPEALGLVTLGRKPIPSLQALFLDRLNDLVGDLGGSTSVDDAGHRSEPISVLGQSVSTALAAHGAPSLAMHCSILTGMATLQPGGLPIDHQKESPSPQAVADDGTEGRSHHARWRTSVQRGREPDRS
jgi:hypothetical protein